MRRRRIRTRTLSIRRMRALHMSIAVALHSAGKSDAAIAGLKKILADHPNNRDVLEALASFYSARGEGMEAKKYADRLKTLTDN